MSTHPDVSLVYSFLSSYNMCPAVSHLSAALYVLHYIHSTHNQGITFSSWQSGPIHTYLQQPDPSDVEAYDDATPPASSRCEHLSTYSDACWGSQLGNSVKAGTLLPLWKFRSMSSTIVFCLGRPITRKTIRQEQTSLSSYEADMHATSKGSKLSVDVRNLATISFFAQVNHFRI